MSDGYEKRVSEEEGGEREEREKQGNGGSGKEWIKDGGRSKGRREETEEGEKVN